MTQRYYFIRREVYELKKSKKYRKNRTFSEMKQLFKPSYWLMIIFVFFMFGSSVSCFNTFVFCESKLFMDTHTLAYDLCSDDAP